MDTKILKLTQDRVKEWYGNCSYVSLVSGE